MSEASELMRNAAELLRARADMATQPPWKAEIRPITHGKTTGHIAIPAQTTKRSRRWLFSDTTNGADVEYVASMHPDFARAIANWLDSEAEIVELFDTTPHRDAELVARVYLG